MLIRLTPIRFGVNTTNIKYSRYRRSSAGRCHWDTNGALRIGLGSAAFLADSETARHRLFCGFVLARTLACGSPAFSGDIDPAAWSCSKFMSGSKEDVGVILAWLDGYYMEEDEPPMINTEELVSNARKL